MLDFLQYDFFQNALISTILIGISCGLVGTYIVAKRMVFISGGITHTSFGGLGVSYYAGFSPMLGATVFAVISALAILFVADNKKIREDSLIGIFWSAGMAIGILFIYLTPGYAPNLTSYLFGSILTVTKEQILLSAALCFFIVIFFTVFYRPLFYIGFDKEYSCTHNIPVNYIEVGITLLIALCIVLCMKLAGIILIISYLTIPQSIAGLFYKNFKQQLIASALISTVGSVIGLFVSAFLST
ncbi:MAG: metal ABC transporter permease, partial [Odoribacter sp.]|nr:metal ABC transporter permease [Odoribacter sp.]